MRNFVGELAEGVIIGFLMAILLLVLGIEATTPQFGAIAGGAIIFTGLASFIGKLIKGQPLYSFQWTYQYGENTITVKASNAEELYINDSLVDRKTGIALKAELKGLLDTGERVTAIISQEKISKQISSDKPLRCKLLVNDKPLQSAEA